MIKEVKVNGWKSGDRHCHLSLTNVLVGENGSGKTSIMDAIRLAATGEVPGLGKQNQMLIKGASSDNPVVSITTEDGDVTLTLKRSRTSVSKSVDGEHWDVNVPLSVPELQAMTASELRTLLSVGGDKLTRSQFKKDILTKAGSVAKECMALFNDQGDGSLSDVDLWVDEIKVIAKNQAANLRETEAALANVRKTLETVKPVPQRVVNEWESRKAELNTQLREIDRKLQSVGPTIVGASRCRARIEESKNTAREAEARKTRLLAFDKSIKELRLKATEVDAAELSSVEQELAQYRERQKQNADYLSGRANFSKWLKQASERIPEAVEKYKLDGQDKKLLLHAAKNLGVCSDNVFVDDDVRTKSVEDTIEELEIKLQSLSEPAREFLAALKERGFDSYAHLEQTIELCESKIASALKDVQAAEKELSQLQQDFDSDLGSDASAIQDELREQEAPLKAELHELQKQINAQSTTLQLKTSEADLVERIDVLAKQVESSKLAAKTAAEIQVQYLEEPIEGITPYLDEFCDVVGLPKIRGQFVKQGRSMTLEVNLLRGRTTISLDVLSGGERLLVGCAFLYALNRLHNPKHPLILVESAELDKRNAERLLKGLCMAGSKGIQSVMTSFDEVQLAGFDYELLWTGKELIA